MKKLAVLSLLVTAVLFIAGCNKSREVHDVKKTIVISGGGQALFPGEESSEIRLMFESPKLPALLGGKGKEVPVAHVPVKYEVLKGSDLEVIHIGDDESDKGGMVRLKIKTGKVLGDNYLKVIPVGYPKAAKILRIINGVKITGEKQEAYVGESLADPIVITLKDTDGDPVEGAEVYLTLTSPLPAHKIKAKLPAKVITNSNGVAEIPFTVGHKTSEYKISAEIVSDKITTRGIEITEMGVDVTSKKGLIVTVLGGLAIFIFGMKLMGDGLQMVAGEKMKSILQFFAKNRFIAVLAGTVVTGVIQSSSTCTVMVVGFVNAGLLKLTQAIGIIFGANIGTTVTAQIIAFKIKDYALPAIIVGLIVMMLLKSKQHKSWGQTILGFGMLFLGMGIMSKALKVVASYPTFIEFFKTFDCTPIDGTMPVGAVIGAIAIGTAMTVIIQSSSATIGIALTLAASGLINFYTAVPLILGDNIGTTITAVLASLGANRRAKQAACAHFIFNIMGTLYMIALFYVTVDGKPIYLWFINEYMASGDVFAEVPENIARHIAMAHTCFNVFNVLVFLPLIGIIAKICERIVPINDESQERPTYLEPQLLNTPSMAIEQTIRTIRYMTKEAWSMVKGSVEGSFLKGEYNEELAEKIATREEKVDDLQEDISAYLVDLTQKELTTSQSNLIPLLMHCNNDAESIADHSERILGLARRLAKSEKKFSKEALQDLLDIWEVVNDQAKNVIEALNNTDKQNINFAIKDKRIIYSMVSDAERKHIERLSKNVCSVLEGVVFIEMLSELERIGSKFSNIAERAVEIQKHHVDLKSK